MLPTIYCQLIAKEPDIGGYTTYVFKNVENSCPFGHRYVMVTRLPNWNHKDLDINGIGYLTYQEVIAGESTWYNGTEMVPYNYTNIYFIKFVSKDNSKNMNNEKIIL